ncbi:hypothetical protein N7509_013531 [Penicillium cosmopolitanum]|uniref:Uncharacterized protein n=1 Tax=Penicillium cosmopolitanum TaxID=1131564 RepID=A0A9W9VEL3_9EURO|nr:uncharacterized protein N7509_013531 [Penicillium cosmopolitanum]KAJ5376645.1 hypothetical protein N7509_013531 [Penicillium cosmopolitanum]
MAERNEPEQLLAPDGDGLYADIPPRAGGWAEWIEKLEWTKAREENELRTAFLIFLSEMKLVREPMWRHRGNQYDTSIDDLIEHIYRIEACRMQISGTLAPILCLCCARGYRQFAHCAMVQDFPKSPTAQIVTGITTDVVESGAQISLLHQLLSS